MECKRFGQGSIYEDVECMLCEKSGKCNSIARTRKIEMRISEAHIDCKNCNYISDCKRYKYGIRCSKFICNLSLKDAYGSCDCCTCLQTCIDKYCKDVKYICKKDIHFKRCYIDTLFIKDNEYTFKVFENKVLYNNFLLSLNNGEVFNKYFEEK